VHQQSIGPRLVVGLGSTQHVVQTPARDETFQARDQAKVLIALGVLHRLDLPAKLIHVRQRLPIAVDERIRFGEKLVLNANRGDAALLELLDQAPDVVEVAEPGVAIQQDRHLGGIRHELDHFEHLGPAGLIVVADAQRRGDGEAAGPDGFESCFLHNARAQPVVRFHQKFKIRRVQQTPKL
jgi:hypothetical protein